MSESTESKFPETVAVKVYAWTPPRSTNTVVSEADVLDMIKKEAKGTDTGLLLRQDITLPKDKNWPINCQVSRHYYGLRSVWPDDLVLPNKVLLAVDVDGQLIHTAVTTLSTASRASVYSLIRCLKLKSTNGKLRVCLGLRTGDTLEGCYLVSSMSVYVDA